MTRVHHLLSPVRCRCSLEETEAESGADSTTHCVHPDGRRLWAAVRLSRREEIRAVCLIRMCVLSGGTSQFSLMELSQSQDLCSEATNNHRGDNGLIASLPEEGATKSGRAERLSCISLSAVYNPLRKFRSPDVKSFFWGRLIKHLVQHLPGLE